MNHGIISEISRFHNKLGIYFIVNISVSIKIETYYIKLTMTPRQILAY